jgi:chromate transporter
MIYLKLFLAFFQVGLFSFGGGYASLPLIQNQVVSQNGWLRADEFTDLISLSQLTPGAIAINASSFAGMRVAGIGGAVCATLGCVLPSTAIVLLLVFIYNRYRSRTAVDGALSTVRPTIVGLIFAAGITILWPAFTATVGSLGFDPVTILLAVGGFLLLRKTDCSPLLLMLLSGGIGLAAYLLLDWLGVALG